MDFIAKFDLLRGVLVDYEAVRRLVKENLEDAAAEGIDYIELRFSPYFMAELHGLDTVLVTEAVCQSLNDAASELGIKAKLICILSRTYGPERAYEELSAAIRFASNGIVAIDLAGNERDFPGQLFVRHFAKAREAGLRTVAHAGEAAGAHSVRQAIEGLGAERIGHAVSAKDDPELLDLIAEREIAIESCPTSNVQTNTVSSYAAHPLPLFLRRGLLVTLNTDDPGISNIDLHHEFAVAEREMGLRADELLQLQKNALKAAFLSDDERIQFVSGLGAAHTA
jgi:adenosine deaminase